MIRKIKSEIHPDHCSYKWFGNYYDKKPPFTVVRYYLVNEYSDVEARLRFRFFPLPVLAIVLACLLYIADEQTLSTTVQLPDYMVVSGGILSVDMNNIGEYPVTVRIYDDNTEQPIVWLEEELLPGTSMSNVAVLNGFPVGERTVKVSIVASNGNKQSSYTNNMIVRVLD